GGGSQGGTFDQTVLSGFAEALVPIIGSDNALPWAKRIDVTLAGRYDSYSSFGSALSPEVGVKWQIDDQLRLRGSYGTSYRAPRLADYDLSINGAVAFWLPDPTFPPGVFSHQLQVIGNDVGGYQAQESKNLSFGADATPSFLEGSRFSLNYFRI